MFATNFRNVIFAVVSEPQHQSKCSENRHHHSLWPRLTMFKVWLSWVLIFLLKLMVKRSLLTLVATIVVLRNRAQDVQTSDYIHDPTVFPFGHPIMCFHTSVPFRFPDPSFSPFALSLSFSLSLGSWVLPPEKWSLSKKVDCNELTKERRNERQLMGCFR